MTFSFTVSLSYFYIKIHKTFFAIEKYNQEIRDKQIGFNLFIAMATLDTETHKQTLRHSATTHGLTIPSVSLALQIKRAYIHHHWLWQLLYIFHTREQTHKVFIIFPSFANLRVRLPFKCTVFE